MLVIGDAPFCLIRRRDEDRILVLRGDVARVRNLDDVPLRAGKPAQECFDSVSLVPFCQARERGFPVRDGGEPIVTLNISEQSYVSVQEVIEEWPKLALELGDFDFDISAPEYERIIARIIKDEIGTGKGSNFVIPRACSFRVPGFKAEHVQSLFRSLLLHEYGAYWTFLFYDGEQYHVGASPERHISSRKGEVRMNPISGTFRKSEYTTASACRAGVLTFLEDEKEIYELFMVVDEELKIMAELCEGGGTVVGPMLKEMSRLMHTEYVLIGHSTRDPISLFRGGMFAPTVTGSPVQSAFRVIEAYEPSSREYYGAALMLLGRDADGEHTLDAPITIRTFAIDKSGQATARVGATLVRRSKPADEVKETEAKIAGLLNAVRQTSLRSAPPSRRSTEKILPQIDPEEIHIRLHRRNLYLSRFWFEPQHIDFNAVPALKSKHIVIIDNEDSFSVMLKRMLEQMGARVTLTSFADHDESLPADLTIVGPGPGDPNDESDPKMVKVRGIVERLIASKRPFLAECLGHQILCRALGLRVARKDLPFQGTQEHIDYFGRAERVGFYNTFCGMAERELPGVSVACDAKTREIHALRGPTYLGVQFHLESILTPSGYALLRDAVLELLGA
jgi:2-amino-4-deoxychorismate synthase